MKKRLSSLLCCMCLLAAVFGVSQEGNAAQLDGCNVIFSIESRAPAIVKAYRFSYDHNLWLSLRDVAAALIGTEKAFGLTVGLDEKTEEKDDWCICLYSGEAYTPVGGEGQPITALDVEDSFYASAGYTRLYWDGREMRLPTYVHKAEKKLQPTDDVYLRLVDLAMYLNLSLTYTGENRLTVDPTADYEYNLAQQESDGYFHDLHSILLADAETGAILYGVNENRVTQIASTTKLMTYLLVKEAMDRGEFTEDTMVTVSETVYALANGEDGIYRQNSGYGSLDLGAQVSVRDLLYAMLLQSSNEAALALGELVSGSEQGFVEQMNERAEALGLESAVFYNPHGLPSYTRSPVPSKRQNEMTAIEMFRLTQYLLHHHGEHLTAITQQTRVELPTFGLTNRKEVAYARSTNALVFNLEGCLGLKTGTTNRSGSCLVTALPVTDCDGNTHDLVLVLFGGEDDYERYEKSAWLLGYAKQYYSRHSFPDQTDLEEQPQPPQQTHPTTEPTEATVPAAPKKPAAQNNGLLLAIGVLGCMTGSVLTLAVVLAVRKRS